MSIDERERLLRERLADLHEDYRVRIEPIMRELTAIHARRPQRVSVLNPSAIQLGH